MACIAPHIWPLSPCLAPVLSNLHPPQPPHHHLSAQTHAYFQASEPHHLNSVLMPFYKISPDFICASISHHTGFYSIVHSMVYDHLCFFCVSTYSIRWSCRGAGLSLSLSSSTSSTGSGTETLLHKFWLNCACLGRMLVSYKGSSSQADGLGKLLPTVLLIIVRPLVCCLFQYVSKKNDLVRISIPQAMWPLVII